MSWFESIHQNVWVMSWFESFRWLVARVMSWFESFYRGTWWVMSWFESIKFNIMSRLMNRFKFPHSNKESTQKKLSRLQVCSVLKFGTDWSRGAPSARARVRHRVNTGDGQIEDRAKTGLRRPLPGCISRQRVGAARSGFHHGIEERWA